MVPPVILVLEASSPQAKLVTLPSSSPPSIVASFQFWIAWSLADLMVPPLTTRVPESFLTAMKSSCWMRPPETVMLPSLRTAEEKALMPLIVAPSLTLSVAPEVLKTT